MKDLTQVLIAEDDDDDFEIFSYALKEVSISIVLTRAEDGEILLKILDSHLPDILFLDVYMPCKDGRTCLKEIRSNKKYDMLPIIMYSSMRDSKTIEFCFLEGANIYVIKPSSFHDLTMALKKILSIEWKKSLYYPARADFVMSPSDE